MISVVIPAYNAESTIADQLAALARQSDQADWELIVADNGSADGTGDVVRGWADRLPVRVVDASARRGPAAARNIGAAAATGEVLAFTDADDVVQPGWLRAMAGFGDRTDIGTGPVFRFHDGDPIPERINVRGGLFHHMGFLPYADGSNTVISRSTFDDAGGFSEVFRTGEDVDLSWRLQLDGTQLAFLPGVAVAARSRADASGIFRQYMAYGRGDVQLYERYRRQGCPRPELWPTLKSYLGLAARLPFLADRRQRERWLHQAGRRAGRMAGSADRRVLFL